jgi:hypothetical protein
MHSQCSADLGTANREKNSLSTGTDRSAVSGIASRPSSSGSPRCRPTSTASARRRLWAKREEQIHGVVETMAGLYGDLQGIAGRSLQEIAGLKVPLLDGPPASEAAE